MRPHLKDGQDVGVIERSRSFGFDFKSGQSIGVGGDKFGQNLDGDVAVQPRVAGPVDLAHTTRTQWRENLILPKLCA